MKVDILITFNDLDEYKGGVSKDLRCVDQLKKLINSIEKNFKYDYEIYTFYSRKLSDELIGYFGSVSNLVFDPEEIGMNRISAYRKNTNGDFSLILDTDILVLNNPNFYTDSEFYAKKSGNKMVSIKTWKEICKVVGIDYSGEMGINNGCLFISNKIKNDLYNCLVKYKPIVKKIIENNKESDHFDDQVLMSILMKKYSNGYFNENINYYTNNNNKIDEETVEILHYLGKNGMSNPHLRKIINKY